MATVHSDDVGVLVRSAASGDKAAWTMLVEHFSGLVWSIARAHRLGSADAEEVFQITWLRLTENMSRLNDPERVGAWLATTARNESLKVIRLGARTTVTDSPYVLDQPSEEESPETVLLEAEEDAARLRRARQLWSAFQQLPGRCQQLLRMLIASPAPSYTEIATMLDIAVGSIGPTRGRCLQRLRTLLAGFETADSPVYP
jgi:RNA polymerase sigma factor (sigma-70 family)